MTPNAFDHLVALIQPHVTKYSSGPKPLTAGHRLGITLRFLATGDGYFSISCDFRVGITTVHNIVKETCAVLWDVLMPIYLPSPTTEKWSEIAKDYGLYWQFPFCCGAMDGKHIVIEQPAHSGSKYHNYKGTNSIVLLALVDAHYRFVAVDIGGYGSQSDGGTLQSSTFGQALKNGSLNLPGASTLPRSSIQVPHVFLGDEAFQLRRDFMRPYPAAALNNTKRIFNYRLSRARRCSENAFGILAQRWRVFRRPIIMKPENVDNVVKAAVVLHNYLMNPRGRDNNYSPPGYADFLDSKGICQDGQWRKGANSAGITSLTGTSARNYSADAADVRNYYAEYFESPRGEVPWQWTLPGVEKPT